MRLGHRLHDGEPKPRARRRHAGLPRIATRGVGPMLLRQAGAAVRDGDARHAGLAPDDDGHRRDAVAQRVENQVLAGLDQRQRVAEAPDRILRQIEPHLVRADQQVVVALLDRPERDRPQVHRLARGGVGAMDDHGVTEHLVGQPAETDRALMDARHDRAAAARGRAPPEASSAWARSAAIGVRSWWDASAIRLPMISNCRAWRAMKRLMAPTSWRIRSGPGHRAG